MRKQFTMNGQSVHAFFVDPTQPLDVRELSAAQRVLEMQARETPADVERELSAVARALRTGDPKLSEAAAMDLAIQRHPDLYRRHVASVEREQGTRVYTT